MYRKRCEDRPIPSPLGNTEVFGEATGYTTGISAVKEFSVFEYTPNIRRLQMRRVNNFIRRF